MNEVDEQIKETLSMHGYDYKEFLGKGGFSSVFLCKSKKYNQIFAVKRAIKHKLTEYEYNALVSLNHTNIIKLYDSFNDDDSQYLVMEYCQNGTIRQKGSLQYDRFIIYAKQILEAIAYCHSNNIAHRDIKPDNIFLDQYNHIKVADFGMARQFKEESKSKEMCGSFKFYSPEMFEYQEICPFKADIWALGITFFYMATGSYPFESKSIEEMKQFIIYGEIPFSRHNIDPKIQFMIKKMTEKNPKLRPPADKLLNFPIFNQNLPLKTSVIFKSHTRYRSHSNIMQSHSLTFESDEIRTPNEEISLSKIHSYQSDFHFHCKQRINRHFLSPKPT